MLRPYIWMSQSLNMLRRKVFGLQFSQAKIEAVLLAVPNLLSLRDLCRVNIVGMPRKDLPKVAAI
jgi:hypothetical protein